LCAIAPREIPELYFEMLFGAEVAKLDVVSMASAMASKLMLVSNLVFTFNCFKFRLKAEQLKFSSSRF
jgi:hypothetical protein